MVNKVASQSKSSACPTPISTNQEDCVRWLDSGFLLFPIYFPYHQGNGTKLLHI